MTRPTKIPYVGNILKRNKLNIFYCQLELVNESNYTDTTVYGKGVWKTY